MKIQGSSNLCVKILGRTQRGQHEKVKSVADDWYKWEEGDIYKELRVNVTYNV